MRAALLALGRRFQWSCLCLDGLCRGMNCRADTRIRGTAANVAAHGAIDVGVRRRCILFKQCGCGHDLAGLAIAALGHLKLDPGRLNRLSWLALKALDCGDVSTVDRRQWRDAGTDRLAVQVDRTRTASRTAHNRGIFGSASSVVGLPLSTKDVDMNDSHLGIVP